MYLGDKEETSFNNIILKIILLFVFCNLVATASLYFFHVKSQQEGLFAEVLHKTRSVGISISKTLEKAVEAGVPLEEIKEGDSYLNEKLQELGELEYIAITDLEGNILAKTDGATVSLKGALKNFAHTSFQEKEIPRPFSIYNTYNLPVLISSYGKNVGYLHLGLSNQAVKDNISNIFYDIVVLLLAALVIGFEFLSFIFKNAVIYPMRDLVRALKRVSQFNLEGIAETRTQESLGLALGQVNETVLWLVGWFQQLKKKARKIKREDQHADLIKDTLLEIESSCNWPAQESKIETIAPVASNIRLVTFLAIFSEAILVTMLPDYAAQLYQQKSYLISSSPIAIFMVFSSFSIPLTSYFSYRFGFRKSFFLGLLLYAFGYFLAFLASDLSTLLVARSFSGFGYGIVFVSCQNYVAAYASAQERVHAYTIFTIASGSAFLCGAAIGGILIDSIGAQYSFLLAFFTAIASLIIAQKYIVDLPGYTLFTSRDTKKKPLDLFKLPSLVFTVLFVGFPLRLIYPTLISFLYPLYLSSTGDSYATIGRLLMIHGFIIFMASTVFPKVVQRYKKPSVFALISALGVAFSLFLGWYWQTSWGMISSIILYSLASAMHVSAMMAILDGISQKEWDNHTTSSILGFYFFFERLGMVVGPILASLMLTHLDYQATTTCLGGIVITFATIYARYYLLRVARKNNKPLEEGTPL